LVTVNPADVAAPAAVLPDVRVSAPAERAILDRINRHPNAARLPASIALDTHRYYLAHSAKANTAVLRFKDQAGLDEWRTRPWNMFRDPPTITDVTVQVLDVLESILDLSGDELARAQLWVSVDEGFRFIVTPKSAGRPIPTARQLWKPSERIIDTLCPPPNDVWFANDTSFRVKFTPSRAFTWRGVAPLPVAPVPGTRIDGVSDRSGSNGTFAMPGKPIQIEAAGEFNEGTILECDGEGRVMAQSTGIGVLRALEQGTPGKTIWAVFGVHYSTCP
jgi:hypothetical protein